MNNSCEYAGGGGLHVQYLSSRKEGSQGGFP